MNAKEQQEAYKHLMEMWIQRSAFWQQVCQPYLGEMVTAEHTQETFQQGDWLLCQSDTHLPSLIPMLLPKMWKPEDHLYVGRCGIFTTPYRKECIDRRFTLSHIMGGQWYFQDPSLRTPLLQLQVCAGTTLLGRPRQYVVYLSVEALLLERESLGWVKQRVAIEYKRVEGEEALTCENPYRTDEVKTLSEERAQQLLQLLSDILVSAPQGAVTSAHFFPATTWEQDHEWQKASM